MPLLEKEQFDRLLDAYYTEHYGKRDTDIWYEKPAVNVWVFKRDGNIITLKSHVLTGAVEECVESMDEPSR